MPPSATHPIGIQFSPGAFGVKNAVLRIESNDSDENPFEVQLSGRGISPQTKPPHLIHCFPPHSALAIPRNTSIRLRIKPQKNGYEANASTIVFSVNDTAIVTGGTPRPGRDVVVTKNDTGYTLHYNPSHLFGEDRPVRIRVQCQDLAYPANSMDSVYSFIIGRSIVHVTKTDTVNQLGGIVFDDSTKIRMTFPVDAVEDDMQIRIGTVENVPYLPDSIVGIGIPYYFWPDGLQTTAPMTIGIPYSHLNLAGVGITDPANLYVYYFSTRRNEWSSLTISDVDLNNKYIFVNVTELCFLILAVDPDSLTGVEQQPTVRAPISSFTLKGNYPNPFNPETVIEYQVHKTTRITLQVYNTLGQRIRTLGNDIHSPGLYRIVWNATNDAGNQVGAGLYFFVIKSDDRIETRKMLFTK